MSHSLPNADVGTHLKVVAIALSCAIVVLLVGINAKISDGPNASSAAASGVMKAGKPTTIATQEPPTIR